MTALLVAAAKHEKFPLKTKLHSLGVVGHWSSFPQEAVGGGLHAWKQPKPHGTVLEQPVLEGGWSGVVRRPRPHGGKGGRSRWGRTSEGSCGPVLEPLL